MERKSLSYSPIQSIYGPNMINHRVRESILHFGSFAYRIRAETRKNCIEGLEDNI